MYKRQIKDSLDILQAQGYRNIEISAIYEGDPSVGGGLGATNNYAIDPSIGTLEDFEDLLREVHARDMSCLLYTSIGGTIHSLVRQMSWIILIQIVLPTS